MDGFTESVTAYVREQDGVDEYGEPVWRRSPVVLERAIVRQLDGERHALADRPHAVEVEYVVCVPKKLSQEELKGAKVALSDRGQGEEDAMSVVKVVDVPQSPLVWNQRIHVGRFDG